MSVAGLIGRKLGMTELFGADGAVMRVTVLQVGPCTVVQRRVRGRDGYEAVQLGFEAQKPQRVSKALLGHVKKAGRGPFKRLREFAVVEGAGPEVGQELSAGDVFEVGDLVDVTGTSKGRGYAGVVRRHGFAGFPATHGTHEYFRHGGSIGCRSFPGRVVKGKRMAGRMGGTRVTIRHLQVVAIRPQDHLLLVRGAVPGPRRALVLVRKSRAARTEERRRAQA